MYCTAACCIIGWCGVCGPGANWPGGSTGHIIEYVWGPLGGCPCGGPGGGCWYVAGGAPAGDCGWPPCG